MGTKPQLLEKANGKKKHMYYDVYRLHNAGWLPAYFAELWRKANGQPDPIQHERWLRQEMKLEKRLTRYIIIWASILAISLLFGAGWLIIASSFVICINVGCRIALAVEAKKRPERYACVKEYKRDVQSFLFDFFPERERTLDFTRYGRYGLPRDEDEGELPRDYDKLKPVITRRIVDTIRLQIVNVKIAERDGIWRDISNEKSTAEGCERIRVRQIALAKKFGLAHPKRHYYDIANRLLKSARFSGEKQCSS